MWYQPQMHLGCRGWSFHEGIPHTDCPSPSDWRWVSLVRVSARADSAEPSLSSVRMVREKKEKKPKRDLRPKPPGPYDIGEDGVQRAITRGRASRAASGGTDGHYRPGFRATQEIKYYRSSTE